MRCLWIVLLLVFSGCDDNPVKSSGDEDIVLPHPATEYMVMKPGGTFTYLSEYVLPEEPGVTYTDTLRYVYAGVHGSEHRFTEYNSRYPDDTNDYSDYDYSTAIYMEDWTVMYDVNNLSAECVVIDSVTWEDADSYIVRTQKIIDSNESVSVGNILFQECLHLIAGFRSYDAYENDHWETSAELWIAPGVGVVKKEVARLDGYWRNNRLIDYTLGNYTLLGIR